MKRIYLSGLLLGCFFSLLHAQTVADTVSTGVRIRINSPHIIPNASPLVFVNGFETDMQSLILNPDNIERIDVRKNKADVAKYGERAKDGVILISTKPGIDFYTITHFINPEKNVNASVKQIELNGKVLPDMKKLFIEKKAFSSTMISSNMKADEENCEMIVNETLVINTKYPTDKQ